MRSTLWLLPSTFYRAKLRRLIDELAPTTGGPVFEPHVTILSGVSVPAEEVLRNLPKLEVSLPALYVEGSGFGDTRYECVFLRLRQTDALTQLHRRAAELFNMPPRPTFTPHISLVYGDLTADTRRRLAADRRLARWVGEAIPGGTIEAWSTDGPEHTWRRLM